MADGFIAIDLTLHSSEFKKQLNSVVTMANLKADAIGAAAKAAGQTAMSAFKGAASAMVDVTKEATALYASYEQLAGGVETIFGDSAAQKVKDYADAAFGTAGISANEYLDTVTTFSASLIKSLGDDTDLAAEYANRAIVDMSDNANKMGTDMASIQNVYSAIAKENYMLIDNLKLGYAGTKEGAQKLVAEASQMRDEMEALGVTVDGNSLSFGNMVNAISVVQKHLGIAGATAEEASSTIEGSVNSARAAWKNWLTGLGRDDADMRKLTQQLSKSISTAAHNLIPTIVTVVRTGFQAVADDGPALAQELWTAVVDSFREAGIESPEQMASALLGSLAAAMDSLASSFTAEDVYNVLDAIGTAIQNGADGNESLAQSAGHIGENIISGIGQYLGEHGGEILTYLADAIFNTPFDLIGNIIAGATGGTAYGLHLDNGEFSVKEYGARKNAVGGIFNKETLLGGGNIVGEAGPEAVIPLSDEVLGKIGAGINAASGGSSEQVAAILSLLSSGVPVTLNARQATHELLPEINRQLGSGVR